MIRREMLGMLGVGAAGLVATTSARAAAQHQGHGHGDVHEECAEACVNCEKECNQGFHHCFTQVQAGKTEHAKAMHLLADCGDICGTSGKLVARMSPLMVHTCAACAASCADTIAAVEALKDDEMTETLEALRACQTSCTEMVKAMGGPAHEHDGGAR
jgi:hypothetical protein